MVRKLLILLTSTVIVVGVWVLRATLNDAIGPQKIGPRAAVGDPSGDFPSVIYNNAANGGDVNPSGGAPASQLDPAFPFDAGAVDDFMLAESPECLWSIEGVGFQGKYWNGEDPGGISAFRIIFWPDTPDGPDGRTFGAADLSKAAAVYEVSGNGGESVTGLANIFAYEVALPEPFDVLPNQRWWIQIQVVMPFPPQWGLAVTNTRHGETPYEYFDLLGLAAWTPIADPGDLAFQLMGSPKAISCDDENACTVDSCDGLGECQNQSITCDDADACTTDSCDPSTGCTFTEISCDDGDECTVDSCAAGVCQFIAAPDFDGDGDIDLSDASVLIGCMVEGDGVGCTCSDLTGDGTTNLRDFWVLQQAFTGGE